MTKATALKVVDLLGLTEEYLANGRPRKAPGKPRPEATDLYGKPMKVSPKVDYWQIDKVSLVGAVKFAAIDQGYSKNVMEWAEAAVMLAALDSGHGQPRLSEIDNEWRDTREIQRLLRRARRHVERNFDL